MGQKQFRGLVLCVPGTLQILHKEFVHELMNPIPQNIVPSLLAICCRHILLH